MERRFLRMHVMYSTHKGWYSMSIVFNLLYTSSSVKAKMLVEHLQDALANTSYLMLQGAVLFCQSEICRTQKPAGK